MNLLATQLPLTSAIGLTVLVTCLLVAVVVGVFLLIDPKPPSEP